MAKNKIYKKDGTPSPYFWSDKDGEEPTQRIVYKQTSKGVKRMKGVTFDPARNRIQKH
ncbi:MAG TPA: hypothetical protein VK849_13540 [Longimicrobiales bacterium]|nr:hypothetical protein [Longimicrobiales bacterium]